MILCLRNETIEPIFDNNWKIEFSGYGEITLKSRTEYKSIFWFYTIPLTLDDKEIEKNLKGLIFNLKFFINLSKDLNIPCYLFKLPVKCYSFSKVLEKINCSLISEYNKLIEESCEKYFHMKEVSFDVFVHNIGIKNSTNFRNYFLFKTPLDLNHKGTFNNWLRRELNSIDGKRKKCLVVDLDNTFWGGVLGEDGINGIKISETFPGIGYTFLHNRLNQYLDSGIILCICSKNNESDVIEAFSKNKNIKVPLDSFLVKKINWSPKYQNIQEIAEELNIGLDSIVFIDDNPMEVESVRETLPGITAMLFPKEEDEIVSFLLDELDSHFESTSVILEDKLKTQLYKQNFLRKSAEEKSNDFENFLKELEIQVELNSLTDDNIERAQQLELKTNQFNSTTRRYNKTDLLNLNKNGRIIYIVNIQDKFGDYGRSGSIILNISENIITIESFILSCRVLGKKIEDELLISIAKKNPNKCLNILFEKTKKNIPVENFLNTLPLINKTKVGRYICYDIDTAKLKQQKQQYKIKINE